MLTEQTLIDLRALLATSAPADRREAMLGALDDTQRTIAAQALVIRNLTADLRNRRIGQEALDAIVPAAAMSDLLTRLGEPRAGPFSMADAQRACAQLAEQGARAGDIAAIAAGIVAVVRAFV